MVTKNDRAVSRDFAVGDVLWHKDWVVVNVEVLDEVLQEEMRLNGVFVEYVSSDKEEVRVRLGNGELAEWARADIVEVRPVSL